MDITEVDRAMVRATTLTWTCTAGIGLVLAVLSVLEPAGSWILGLATSVFVANIGVSTVTTALAVLISWRVRRFRR